MIFYCIQQDYKEFSWAETHYLLINSPKLVTSQSLLNHIYAALVHMLICFKKCPRFSRFMDVFSILLFKRPMYHQKLPKNYVSIIFWAIHIKYHFKRPKVIAKLSRNHFQPTPSQYLRYKLILGRYLNGYLPNINSKTSFCYQKILKL